MKILRIGSTGGELFTLLKNSDDLKRYINSYCKELSITINIGDISLLSVEAQSILLKFIEEEVNDVLCYASRDNISLPLQSRFDKVEKFEDIKIGLDDFQTFVKHMEDKEKVDCIEREFLGKSSEFLNSFLIYRRCNKAILSRIGGLL